MLSHDTVAGHGHVTSHAIGIVGASRHCPEQGPRQTTGKRFLFVAWIAKGDLEYYASVLCSEHWQRCMDAVALHVLQG